MKKLISILICLSFCLMAPAFINAETVGKQTDYQVTEESVEPLKTYYLLVLGGAGRREVTINPPATKIIVTSQSGDTTIRCGDEQNTYICSPGKRLELEYEVDTPLIKFWAENVNETQVRLQIDVYQTIPTENCSAQSEQNNQENIIPQS